MKNKKFNKAIQGEQYFRFAVLVLTITGVVFVGVIFFNQRGNIKRQEVLEEKDYVRFNSALKDIKKVATSIKESSSIDVDSEKQNNSCFNTRQGPFDDGELWCQVAYILTLDSNEEFSTVGKEFTKTAKKANLSTRPNSSFGVMRYSFTSSSGMQCNLSYKDKSGIIEGASAREVLVNEEVSSLAISCADQALKAHYVHLD